jgi:hypothetical protein
MARKLEDIFNECYERIRSGESLKSCLKRYPKHAAELEPLLKTVFDIGRRASYIHPRPEFKHWARVNLEGIRHHARQQRQPAKPGPFIWRQSWSVAVAAVLIIVLTGSSTVIASSNALPDEPLYPVKLATEDMKLAFAVSDTQKAQVHTQLAETRAVEVETMADQGKTEYAAMTAARLAKELELANFAIAKVEYNVGTTPIPTTTEDQPLPTEEQPLVTEEQPPVTEEQPPVTEEQPLTTEEQPPVTEEQPTPPEDESTPATFSTRDAGTTARTERFKKSLENSTSRSLKALEGAMEKAPPHAKPDWQQAINVISEKRPAPVWPSQPTPQSDNTTRDGGEAPVLPSWPTPQSDNTTWDQGKPNPFSPYNNQPSSSEWQNTGNKDWPFNKAQNNWSNNSTAK